MCMKIKDRKDVKMLFTCHSATSVQTGKRDHRGHEIHRCSQSMNKISTWGQLIGVTKWDPTLASGEGPLSGGSFLSHIQSIHLEYF